MLDYNLTIKEAKVLCAISSYGPTGYYELAVSTGSLQNGTQLQTFLTRLIDKGLVKQSERGRFFELSEDGRAVQGLIGQSQLRTFYKSNKYSVLIVPDETEQAANEPKVRPDWSGLEGESEGGQHATGGSGDATRDRGRVDDRDEDSNGRVISSKTSETDWSATRDGGPLDARRDAAIEREIKKMESGLSEPPEGRPRG